LNLNLRNFFLLLVTESSLLSLGNEVHSASAPAITQQNMFDLGDSPSSTPSQPNTTSSAGGMDGLLGDMSNFNMGGAQGNDPLMDWLGTGNTNNSQSKPLPPSRGAKSPQPADGLHEFLPSSFAPQQQQQKSADPMQDFLGDSSSKPKAQPKRVGVICYYMLPFVCLFVERSTILLPLHCENSHLLVITRTGWWSWNWRRHVGHERVYIDGLSGRG
jgi:hypothetical protein